MQEDFRRHCFDPGLAASSLLRCVAPACLNIILFAHDYKHRGQLYASLFTHVIRQHRTETKDWRPFSWVMDLTSGSRMNVDLREKFQVSLRIMSAVFITSTTLHSPLLDSSLHWQLLRIHSTRLHS